MMRVPQATQGGEDGDEDEDSDGGFGLGESKDAFGESKDAFGESKEGGGGESKESGGRPGGKENRRRGRPRAPSKPAPPPEPEPAQPAQTGPAGGACGSGCWPWPPLWPPPGGVADAAAVEWARASALDRGEAAQGLSAMHLASLRGGRLRALHGELVVVVFLRARSGGQLLICTISRYRTAMLSLNGLVTPVALALFLSLALPPCAQACRRPWKRSPNTAPRDAWPPAGCQAARPVARRAG